MPFQVSPGVNVSEIDLTTTIPAVSTSVGAFAGNFQWGPALVSRLVTSEVDLVQQFGEPTNDSFEDFFSAASFLAYSNALRVVRVVEDDNSDGLGSSNAQELGSAGTATDQGLLIKNDEHFVSGLTFANTFYAKHAGSRGNNLRIELCDHAGSTTEYGGRGLGLRVGM